MRASAQPEPPMTPATYLDSIKVEPIHDPVERKKFIDSTLTSILGPERMKVRLLPSGHSGIDPIIAEHNNRQMADHMLAQQDAIQAEERRKFALQQQQAAEEEANRSRIATLLEYHRGHYLERLQKLAQYGPQLAKGIDMLEHAIQHADMQMTYEVSKEFFEAVVDPIDTMFQIMAQEIALEEEGAAHLKTVWPLERMSALHSFLSEQDDLPKELLILGQGLEAVAWTLMNPTPFQNPLDLQPQQSSGFQHSYNNRQPNDFTITDAPIGGVGSQPGANITIGAPIAGSSAPGTDQASAPVDNKASFGSFADMLKSQKSANLGSQDTQKAPGITITAPTPTTATAPGCSPGPSSAPVLPGPSSSDPSGNFETGPVRFQITSTAFDLEDAVKKLVNNNNVSSHYRSEITNIFQDLLAFAQNNEGLFESDDAQSFLPEVQRCAVKLGKLPSAAARHPKTKTLIGLTEKVQKLWR